MTSIEVLGRPERLPIGRVLWLHWVEFVLGLGGLIISQELKLFHILLLVLLSRNIVAICIAFL